MRPIINTKLAVYIAGVDFDCVQREVKPSSDFLVGQPLGDELEYFNFAPLSGSTNSDSGA